jgi:hypothetical protein
VNGHHAASGPRQATVWLRRRDAGRGEFVLVRDPYGRPLFFEGTCPHEHHRNGMDPAVDEAIEFIAALNPQLYDAYEIVVWSPQRYSAGTIGENR